MADAYAIEETAFDSENTFSFPSPSRARPKPGALLVLFVRKGNEEILFTGTAAITAGPEDQELLHDAKWMIGRVSRFESPRSLIQLGGSLQRTRRFLEPWRDFASWIVALSIQDFHTIREDAIAMARSVYRSLFHALPLEMQAEFVRRHANLLPAGRQQFEYEPLALTLLDYLRNTLEEHWRLFGSLQASYPTSVEGVPPLSDLWLTNGDADTRLSRGAIRFGSDVIELHRLLSRVAFPTERAEFSLLRECRTQLEQAEPEERGRKWIDQIF